MKNDKLYLLLVYTIAASASPSPVCLNISEHPDLKKALEEGWHIENISSPSITENGNAIKVSINVSLSQEESKDFFKNIVDKYSNQVEAMVNKVVAHYEDRIEEMLREPTEEEKAQEEAERQVRIENSKKWEAEFNEKKERFQKGELTEEEINEILAGFFDPQPMSFLSKTSATEKAPKTNTKPKNTKTKK